MDKLKAVLTRREDPEANNITEDDRGFISETLDASTLSYRSFQKLRWQEFGPFFT